MQPTQGPGHPGHAEGSAVKGPPLGRHVLRAVCTASPAVASQTGQPCPVSRGPSER